MRRSLSIYKVLGNWKGIVEKLTNSAREILGDIEVIPFGSVVEGEAVATSDLDVLVVAKAIPKNAWNRAQIKSKIEEAMGLPPLHPIQIHLTTWEETETNPIYKGVLTKYRKK